jgi:hypothetical protein
MSNLSIVAAINVHRPEGHSAYAPGTSEELAIIALDLLVRDIGYEAARQFIDRVLERYRNEPHAHAEPLGQTHQTGAE